MEERRFTDKERQNMIDFVFQVFGSKVYIALLYIMSDDELENIYNEAYSYSEWGL